MNVKTQLFLDGRWIDNFNGKTTSYCIQIIKSNVRYGSGDDREPIELSKDMYMECYYIIWIENNEHEEVSTRSELSYRSFDEAVQEVEKITNGEIEWNDK